MQDIFIGHNFCLLSMGWDCSLQFGEERPPSIGGEGERLFTTFPVKVAEDLEVCNFALVSDTAHQ